MRDAADQIIFLLMSWCTIETMVSTNMRLRGFWGLSGPRSTTNWAVKTEMDWLSAQGVSPIAPQGSVDHSSLIDKIRWF